MYWLPDVSEKPCWQPESSSRSVLHIGCPPSPAKSFGSVLWHISVGFSELLCTSWGFSPEHWCCSIAVRPHAESISLLFICAGTHRPASWSIHIGSSFVTCQRKENICLRRVSTQPCSRAALPSQVSAWVRLARACPGVCCYFWRRLDCLLKTKMKNKQAAALGCALRAACSVTACVWESPALPFQLCHLTQPSKEWGPWLSLIFFTKCFEISPQQVLHKGWEPSAPLLLGGLVWPPAQRPALLCLRCT